ncbi:MAG TPA: glutamine amidotransferase [Candidatus Brocadiia bacterium]|nr:glutamine amidotransferase [Candidatus Brocadiia bacterium]
MAEPRLVFNPLMPWWLALPLCAALGCFTISLYLPYAKDSGKRFVLLLSARIAAFLMLCACILRPGLQHKTLITDRPFLVLMTDISESMGAVKDSPSGRSRSDAITETMSANASLLDLLDKRYRLLRFLFAGGVSPADAVMAQNSLASTSYGAAIAGAMEEMGSARGAGIILIGDGRNNSGPDPRAQARLAANAQVPLFTVAVGTTTEAALPSDVMIESLRCPPVAFANAPFRVEVKVIARACRDRSAELVFRFGDQPPEKRKLDFNSHTYSQIFDFDVKPTVEGEFPITASIEPLADELLTENNSRTRFVKVLKSGLRVIIFDRFRPEFKFMRLALRGAPQMSVKARLAPRRLDYPLTAEEWNEYDVAVIGDVDVANMPEQCLPLLEKKVADDAAGVLFIAGWRNMSGVLPPDSALGRLLPVRISGANQQWTQRVRFLPTADGLGHSILRMPGTDAASIWRSLPLLEGCMVAREIKPGATVLGEADEQKYPLLVVQRYGKGRAAALLADTTAAWAFGTDADPTAHARFWRQLVMWVGGREDSEDKLVWIDLLPSEATAQRPVDIRIHVKDKQGANADKARLTVAVMRNRDKTRNPIQTTYDPAEACFIGKFVPKEPGDYMVEASAELESTELGRDEARFFTNPADSELDNPVADHALLKDLAALTSSVGGEFFELSGMDELMKKLLEKETQSSVYRIERVELWDHAAVFWIFSVCLLAEWLLRKTRGMA